MANRTKIGLEIEAGLREAIAHRQGKIALETVIVEPMSASRVKAIRKSVAKSPREFEAKFGIPRRTVEGWEQGRSLDVSSRALLTIIEREPEAARRALTSR